MRAMKQELMAKYTGKLSRYCQLQLGKIEGQLGLSHTQLLVRYSNILIHILPAVEKENNLLVWLTACCKAGDLEFFRESLKVQKNLEKHSEAIWWIAGSYCIDYQKNFLEEVSQMGLQKKYPSDYLLGYNSLAILSKIYIPGIISIIKNIKRSKGNSADKLSTYLRYVHTSRLADEPALMQEMLAIIPEEEFRKEAIKICFLSAPRMLQVLTDSYPREKWGISFVKEVFEGGIGKIDNANAYLEINKIRQLYTPTTEILNSWLTIIADTYAAKTIATRFSELYTQYKGIWPDNYHKDVLTCKRAFNWIVTHKLPITGEALASVIDKYHNSQDLKETSRVLKAIPLATGDLKPLKEVAIKARQDKFVVCLTIMKILLGRGVKLHVNELHNYTNYPFLALLDGLIPCGLDGSIEEIKAAIEGKANLGEKEIEKILKLCEARTTFNQARTEDTTLLEIQLA